MKRVFILLVALVVGGLAGSWVKNLPGFVIIAWEKTSVEMRLWVAVVFVLLTICIVLLLIYIVRSILGSAGKIRGWHGGRSWRRSRRKTIEGMLAFTEGRWKKSEDAMVEAAKISDTQLINYLVAAQAAQHQNAEVRRDAYLRLAYQAEPAAKVAIGLTQAQLQLQQNQLEQALASLKDLQQESPNHPYILKLLAKIFEQLQDWDKLLEILPLLKKHKVLDKAAFQKMESHCISGLISQFAKRSDVEGMQDCWQNLSSNIRKKKSHILFYAQNLIDFEQWDEAESLVKPLIKKSADAEVLALYGNIESSLSDKQFSFLESWLSSSTDAPREVYLTLGKLAFRCQLWGKARHFLERSLHLKPSAEGYLMMAKVLEQLGESGHAIDCYQKGLEFVASPKYLRDTYALPNGSDDLINADLLPKFQTKEEN